MNNEKIKSSIELLNDIEHRHLLTRYILFIIALAIYAVSYNTFFVSNNLIFGGSSSIATIIKDYVDPSITILFISVISLILSFCFLGKRFALNTIVGSFLFPLFVNLTSNLELPVPKDDMILVAVCGAVLIGFADGLMGRTGIGSGGLNSIIQIISKKLKISYGKSILFVNGIIVVLGGFTYGYRVFLYAIMILYIISIVTDKVLLSISMNKTFFIVTEEVEKVKEFFLVNLSRGVTVLDAHGGFTNDKEKVIMVVIPTIEYFKAKEGILDIDPNAFFTIMDSYQALNQDSHRKKENKEGDK